MEVKSLEFFSKDIKDRLGISRWCKVCMKSYQQKLASEKKEKTKHYSFGVCCRCKKARLETSKFCLKCLVEQTLKRAVLRSENIPALKRQELVTALIKKLEKSEYSCFYTGLKLVPGLNLSLDHRIPIQKGGTTNLENLEWVHSGINSLKNDRTEKEFIAAYGSMLVEYSLLASKGII